MGEARSPAVRDRIGFQVHRNDWNGGCCSSRGTDGRRSGSGDGSNALLHQFLRQCGESVELVIGVTGHDLDFGNLPQTALTYSTAERRDTLCGNRIQAAWTKKSYPPFWQ